MKVKSIRKLAPFLGLSHTAASSHYNHGKFKCDADGMFDVELCKSALAMNRSINQPSQAKGVASEYRQGMVASAIAVNGGAVDYRDMEDAPLANDGGNPTLILYNRAKAQKEVVKAQEAELDLRKRLGELIEVAEAEKVWSGMISAARSALLLFGAKVAPKVAALNDARECEAVIDKEIRAALSVLSEYRPLTAE